MPGRGPTLTTPEAVRKGLAYTRDFVTTLYASAQEAVAQKMDLKATMAHTRRAMDPKFAQVFIYEGRKLWQMHGSQQGLLALLRPY